MILACKLSTTNFPYFPRESPCNFYSWLSSPPAPAQQRARHVTAMEGHCQCQRQRHDPFDPSSVIRELKKEIETLRAENSDLKFHLYLLAPEKVLHRTDGFLPLLTEYQYPASAPSSVSVSTWTGGDAEGEESWRWLKLVKENRMIVAELRIQELEKEIRELKSTGLEIFQFQLPPSTRPPSPSNSGRGGTGRHGLSNSDSNSNLPPNYKESVATLPPIGAKQLLKFANIQNMSLNQVQAQKKRRNSSTPPKPLKPVHQLNKFKMTE